LVYIDNTVAVKFFAVTDFGGTCYNRYKSEETVISMLQLSDILAAKEARAKRQAEMRKQYGLPLISITVNMPGREKDTHYTRQLVDYAAQEIAKKIDIAAMYRINPPTGPECLLAVHGIAREIKGQAVTIEEAQPFGRLLDIDVFAADGAQLSRAAEGIMRRCLVCNRPAAECMHERRHSQKELAAAVQKLITGFRTYLTSHNVKLEQGDKNDI
jgi:holo-ACP synthase CitX